jgi:hypothetical protein
MPEAALSQGRSPRSDLNHIVLERIILSYATGFELGRVVVTAKVAAQDELSCARAKCHVQAALDLVTPGTAVVIASAQLAL